MADDQGGNIQQRVFDLFPQYPQSITLYTLIQSLPFFDRASIVNAVNRLIRRRSVERVQGALAVYRRRKGSSRPVDMRGHHGNSGRPRAHQ